MIFLNQNSFQDTQTDLEVILEFLEEYYRENTGENGKKMLKALSQYFDLIVSLSDVSLFQRTRCTGLQVCLRMKPHMSNTGRAMSRKVRLFHFLFEMLEDPAMAHCVSWVPTSTGVFRFSSRNKDQVAALWGQRKGNKRPMTYQKMSRALRNYARSGEIFKVKKKLTYRFSQNTLMLLQKCSRKDL
uniref:Transcription factor Spi-C n=1 Tax=Sphaeramia orbicularis TaxID=375764 RepID=A0A672ZGN2_9TELE